MQPGSSVVRFIGRLAFIGVIAAITAGSGVVVLIRMRETRPASFPIGAAADR